MQDFDNMTDHQLADAIHQLGDEMRNRGNLADKLRADLADLRGGQAAEAEAAPPVVADTIEAEDWYTLHMVIRDALLDARQAGDTEARPQASVWEVAHANGQAIQLAGLACYMDALAEARRIGPGSRTLARDWDMLARLVRADETRAVVAYDEAQTEYARGMHRGAIDVLLSVHQDMAAAAFRKAQTTGKSRG